MPRPYNLVMIRISAVLLLAIVTPAQISVKPTEHTKEFWRGLIEKKAPPPANENLSAMLAELSGYLGSTDPELRDDIAYSVLTSWIYRQRVVPVDQRRALMAEWIANLSKGIGDRNNDLVLRRSFSALALGVLAILDNEAPYLERAEFDRLLTATLTYLRDERDLRGFDADKGWIHSVAHTADLLRFLARSKHLPPEQQPVILAAIAEKVSVVDHVFAHGEDERLARAVLSIIARPDFDEAAFRRWLSHIAVRPSAAPTPASLVTGQNRRHLLMALYVVISLDIRELPAFAIARELVLTAMRGA